MIGYASRTGTKRNLAGLRAADWRLMVSAKGVLRHEGFRYALDNGAWNAFVTGTEFDEAAFLKAYALLGIGADFVVLPDIVAGGARSLARSLAFSLRWRTDLPAHCPFLLAVQDGMTPEEVGPLIGPELGIFIGGTTEWKVSTAATWGALARSRDAHMHVGRVNTVERIRICHAAGAHSFDGSGPSRFAVILPRLDRACRQPDLLAPS